MTHELSDFLKRSCVCLPHLWHKHTNYICLLHVLVLPCSQPLRHLPSLACLSICIYIYICTYVSFLQLKKSHGMDGSGARVDDSCCWSSCRMPLNRLGSRTMDVQWSSISIHIQREGAGQLRLIAQCKPLPFSIDEDWLLHTHGLPYHMLKIIVNTRLLTLHLAMHFWTLNFYMLLTRNYTKQNAERNERFKRSTIIPWNVAKLCL